LAFGKSTQAIIMGAFYGNITLKGPEQKTVTEALRGRRALVAPKRGDYTTVFDSACDDQDTDAIQALTSRLSKELHCAALAAIVHDDDVLAYFLYESGELTDWYNSAPSYFDFGAAEEPAGPAGGNAQHLCNLFAAGSPEDVEGVLRSSDYVFQTERHQDLVRMLSLPAYTVGTALASFERGECPDGLTGSEMMRAADPPPVETQQQRWDRQFYTQLGPEDPARPCKHEGCKRGAIANSVMCKRHHFEMIQHRDCPFND
jgi:hypothetical protein